MEAWIDFALARYNYWIFILLMMTGLYVVFARGNLVKKIVGLNIFQTSVFIYYISIGKIIGGTAPIYMGGELEAAAAHHGAEEGHGAESLHEGDANSMDAAHDAPAVEPTAAHAKIDNTALDNSNEMKEALKSAPPASDTAEASVHVAPHAEAGKIANDALSAADKTPPGIELSHDAGAQLHDAVPGAAHDAANAIHGAVEAVVYTNPLPHVLILTAIVVGVATTAVGLALAVRIREAYGTIEEDELEAADNIAEFGETSEAAA